MKSNNVRFLLKNLIVLLLGCWFWFNQTVKNFKRSFNGFFCHVNKKTVTDSNIGEEGRKGEGKKNKDKEEHIVVVYDRFVSCCL